MDDDYEQEADEHSTSKIWELSHKHTHTHTHKKLICGDEILDNFLKWHHISLRMKKCVLRVFY